MWSSPLSPSVPIILPTYSPDHQRIMWASPSWPIQYPSYSPHTSHIKQELCGYSHHDPSSTHHIPHIPPDHPRTIWAFLHTAILCPWFCPHHPRIIWGNHDVAIIRMDSPRILPISSPSGSFFHFSHITHMSRTYATHMSDIFYPCGPHIPVLAGLLPFFFGFQQSGIEWQQQCFPCLCLGAVDKLEFWLV